MNRTDFWMEVFTFHGSVSPFVLRRVFLFGGIAGLIWLGSEHFAVETGLGVAPYEIIGAILALLLVHRTNAGYDRWYEARKLWGGIVNQSRNLAQIGLQYGPSDARWRNDWARWVAAFSHAARHSLRGERNLDDLRELLGEEEASALSKAAHLPTYVTGRLAKLLRQAIEEGGLDRFAFLQAERERALLIDHIGACERILNTPLAQVFSIKIRRFLFLYLVALPIGIVDKSGKLTPILTMIIAYPLLSLDQIGVELQNPFPIQRLGSLPLMQICRTIEDNVMALLEADTPPDVVAVPVAEVQRSSIPVAS